MPSQVLQLQNDSFYGLMIVLLLSMTLLWTGIDCNVTRMHSKWYGIKNTSDSIMLFVCIANISYALCQHIYYSTPTLLSHVVLLMLLLPNKSTARWQNFPLYIEAALHTLWHLRREGNPFKILPMALWSLFIDPLHSQLGSSEDLDSPAPSWNSMSTLNIQNNQQLENTCTALAFADPRNQEKQKHTHKFHDDARYLQPSTSSTVAGTIHSAWSVN